MISHDQLKIRVPPKHPSASFWAKNNLHSRSSAVRHAECFVVLLYLSPCPSISFSRCLPLSEERFICFMFASLLQDFLVQCQNVASYSCQN